MNEDVVPETSHSIMQRNIQNVLKFTTTTISILALSDRVILPELVHANIIDDLNAPDNITLTSNDLDRVTAIAYFDIKIANYTEESIGKNKAATGSGRIVVGLFGKDSPLSVARFLETVQSNGTDLPTYLNSQFGRIIDGTLLQIDDNQRLDVAMIAGEPQYQYQGNLLTDYKPILEANTLRHDR
jgi:hypothetical protein